MVRGVLLDLSGVLYQGDRALPGAPRSVESLRQSGLPLRFLTNTTRSTSDALLKKLSGLGFDLPADQLYAAPRVARDYLHRHGLSPFPVIHPDLRPEFADCPERQADAVLVGDAGPGFTYERLNGAFRLLLEGAPLLAMGRNRYFREEDGLSLDQGPFVAALEYAAQTRAVILGKPAPAFFEAALRSLDLPAGEVVMVGDDVESDVRGALDNGLQAVLVRTGKFRAGDEAAVAGSGAVVCEDLEEAARWILERART
ncbi:TIGR01458 family HAD-type hydrolase [Thiohalorhabdus methylotrophus]|uniref:Haloacid dehalogenase-like hydrolase domain-containing protein 2 n=1 Tax=Thiohalorhabdus methylotrophus TaxID=3242694 RepID=A0ABV4TX43_9GAMM